MHRQKTSTRLTIVSLFLFLLTGLFACAPAGTPRHKDTPPTAVLPKPALLRVGICPNAPPLIYKEGKRYKGLEVDFARKLARSIGKKVQFMAMELNALIPALEKGEIDIIMSSMTITPERQQRIAFSNPYLRSGQILLVRDTQKDQFSSGIYTIMNSNRSIGTIRETRGYSFVSNTLHKATIQYFTEPKEAVQALINKEIDAFLYDAPVVCYHAAIQEETKLSPILHLVTEEYLAWGIRKDNALLLEQANTFLSELNQKQQLLPMIRARIPFM